MSNTDFHYRHVDANGIRLFVAEAGSGPPVVFLHGFPAHWYSWRHQLAGLAAAGFHAIAPDMRGYGQSDAPPSVRAYRGRELVADVADLLRSCGDSCYLVGHDWGGGVAWRVAAEHPQLVKKLAILNAPHAARFAEVLRSDPRQCLRSWYMLFFQLPWLPEWLLTAGDYRAFDQAWRREPRTPGAITDADIAHFKDGLRRHGLRGPLNYYRAACWYGRDLFRKDKQHIAMPTLLIWGAPDPYLGVNLTEKLERWVPQLRIARLDASHWVQHDRAAEVNPLLIEFFRE